MSKKTLVLMVAILGVALSYLAFESKLAECRSFASGGQVVQICGQGSKVEITNTSSLVTIFLTRTAFVLLLAGGLLFLLGKRDNEKVGLRTAIKSIKARIRRLGKRTLLVAAITLLLLVALMSGFLYKAGVFVRSSVGCFVSPPASNTSVCLRSCLRSFGNPYCVYSSPTPTPTPTPSPRPESIKYYVKVIDTPTGFLRVREEPSIGSKETGKVYSGEVYPVLYARTDAAGSWVKIKYNEETTGWINEEYTQRVKN